MQLTVSSKKNLKGTLHVPGDKSISHRAIIIGSLAAGETIVNGFLPSADCLATVDCLGKLGIPIQMSNDPSTSLGTSKCQMLRTENKDKAQHEVSNECKIIIKGKGLSGLTASKEMLDVGNSGTTIRLLSGILAGQPFTTKITGDKSIQKRPMMRIVKPLREMGAEVRGSGGEEIYAPLTIKGGKLNPIEYELPVASAQVKSAILLAGLFAGGETIVVEKKQARDHTERMLAYFGADIKVTTNQLTVISKIIGNREFEGKEIDVPGDLSSAAFFLVAGLIVPNSELLIRNVGVNPTRTGIIDVLHRMGAQLEVSDEQMLCEEPRASIRVTTTQQHSNVETRGLRGIKISGEIIPRIIDEIPIIAVAATQAQGTTEIRGARELRIKESDRIKTISSELRKMGAEIKELEDGMIISGSTKLKGAKVKSYGDHRIAMALAIAGLAASGETVVEDSGCMETSFPGFRALLTSLTT